MATADDGRYAGTSTKELERLLREAAPGYVREAIIEELTRRYTQDLLDQPQGAQASQQRQPSAAPTYTRQYQAPPAQPNIEPQPAPQIPASHTVAGAPTPARHIRKGRRPFLGLISMLIIGITIYYIYEHASGAINNTTGTICVTPAISCQWPRSPLHSACYCTDQFGANFPGTIQH